MNTQNIHEANGVTITYQQEGGAYCLDIPGRVGNHDRKALGEAGWQWVRGLRCRGAFFTHRQDLAELAASRLGIEIVEPTGLGCFTPADQKPWILCS